MQLLAVAPAPIQKTAKTKADGDSRSHFYEIWLEMKKKCDNTNFKYYNENLQYDPKWKDYLGFKEDMFDSFNEYIADNGEKNVSLLCSNNIYSKNTCTWSTYNLLDTLHNDDPKFYYQGSLYTQKQLYDNFCKNITYSGFTDRMYKSGYKNGDTIYDNSIFYKTESPIRFLSPGSSKLTEKMFFRE